MKVQYQLDSYEVAGAEDLLNLMAKVHPSGKGSGAFWLWVDDDPVFALFLKGDNAIVVHEPSLTYSQNPEYAGDKEDTEEFILENGEESEMPAEAVISSGDAVEAFLHFFKTGKLSESISWG